MTAAMVAVMRAIELCRTAALGGHADRCDHCGHEEGYSYNSCRNRHCPKCQAMARAQWVGARLQELLPVRYFHVVLTIPECLAPLALHNKKVVYNILFRAASQALLQIADDDKHLGARIGFLAVLHTWGQTLRHHPHLHCIVPAGGLSQDGTRFIHRRPVRSRRKKLRKPFFLPVAVLADRFRNLFLDQLQQAFDQAQLRFSGTITPLASPSAFAALLQTARKIRWVVYANPPFGGPQQVLKYLGCYTHSVAISNHRLLELQDGRVTFRYKDYRHDGDPRTMTLAADEFIRRFLQHVLPSGFQRIRYYGFLGNRCRANNLALCRSLLNAPATTVPQPEPPPNNPSEPRPCPVCAKGRLKRVALPRMPPPPAVPLLDSS